MSDTNWKRKAMDYTLDKKSLNKRIKEITKSRDDWKAKSIQHKARADKLESDLNKIKKKLIELTSSP
ncbi:MAG: hypothetical protein LBE79_13380 [Tannerella sp.]|jgi:chromosome segregation ATPase|nr:hypothetical protein [Tannerella sp.]